MDGCLCFIHGQPFFPENIFGNSENIFRELLYLMHGNELLHTESSGGSTGRDLPQIVLAPAGRQSALRMPADWTTQSTLVGKEARRFAAMVCRPRAAARTGYNELVPRLSGRGHLACCGVVPSPVIPGTKAGCH